MEWFRIDTPFDRRVPMPDLREATRSLAQAHYLVEPGLVSIFRLIGPAGTEEEPIKLLEVNRDTVPTGIMPLGFDAAPDRGIPYPSIIVEVTPDEYEQIRSGALALPNGWRIGDEIPNESAGVAVE
jgi:hypothetical protein